MDVPFTGAEAGTEPLTWGEKAILQDMRASGNQFSMGGRLDLPAGSTVADAAARLSGLVVRHSALRTRLETDSAGRLSQDVAGSGQLSLDILTLPDDADPSDAAQYAVDLMESWPLERFDFHRDWPLRMAVVRHRGACLDAWSGCSRTWWPMAGRTCCSWTIWSRTAAPATGGARSFSTSPEASRTSQLRQLSRRAMRHWEAQLRDHPGADVRRARPPAGPCRAAILRRSGSSRPPRTWPCWPSPGAPGPTRRG